MDFKKIYEDILNKKLPEPNDSGDIKTTCPFHNDESPSFTIDTKTGLWNCFKPDCLGGGNFLRFVKEYKNLSEIKAKEFIRKNYPEAVKSMNNSNKNQKPKKKQPPAIDEKIVHKWTIILKKSNKILSWLLNERGITKDTIDKYQLGWDGKRITIPVKDNEGKIRNVRKYKPNKKKNESKFISYA